MPTWFMTVTLSSYRKNREQEVPRCRYPRCLNHIIDQLTRKISTFFTIKSVYVYVNRLVKDSDKTGGGNIYLTGHFIDV